MTTGALPTTAQDAAALGYRVKQLFVRNAVAKDVDTLPTDLAAQIGHALNDAALRLTFTVSTDTVDLAGDAMARSALDQMATQAIGTLFFMNHSWGVPEDVLGVVEAARVVQRVLVVPETGETVAVWCLDFTVRVAGSNPRAVQIYNLVTLDHMPVDASVTIIITDDKSANGINTINDVVYLECSAVGIGMNTLATVLNDGQKSIARLHETPAATGDKETSMSEPIKDVPALVEKAGAKHSTDTLDHLTALHDAAHGSLDHMNALGVGCAKCMKAVDDGDGDDDSASKAYTVQFGALHTKIAGLESEKARLSTELAAKTATIDQLTAEKADAERTAEVAVAMLEHIEQQPMPLGQS